MKSTKNNIPVHHYIWNIDKIKEESGGPANSRAKAGDLVLVPSEDQWILAVIKDGQYMDPTYGRLSNVWGVNYVLADGTLEDKVSRSVLYKDFYFAPEQYKKVLKVTIPQEESMYKHEDEGTKKAISAYRSILFREMQYQKEVDSPTNGLGVRASSEQIITGLMIARSFLGSEFNLEEGTIVHQFHEDMEKMKAKERKATAKKSSKLKR